MLFLEKNHVAEKVAHEKMEVEQISARKKDQTSSLKPKASKTEIRCKNGTFSIRKQARNTIYFSFAVQ